MTDDNIRRSGRHGQAWDNDYIPLTKLETRLLCWATAGLVAIAVGVVVVVRLVAGN